MSDKIITPDMPEALKEVKENVNVYISRDGKGYLDEQTARWAGATHLRCKQCETGFTTKGWTICESCRGAKEKTKMEKKIDQWNKLPETSLPDEYAMFYCIVHNDFMRADDESICEYCEENDLKPSDLRLVLASKTSMRQIDYDFFCDDVHEDHEFSAEFDSKLKEFNAFLSNYDTTTYEVPNLNFTYRYITNHIILEEDEQ